MRLTFLDAMGGPGLVIFLLGGFIMVVVMIIIMTCALIKICKIIRARKESEKAAKQAEEIQVDNADAVMTAEHENINNNEEEN